MPRGSKWVVRPDGRSFEVAKDGRSVQTGFRDRADAEGFVRSRMEGDDRVFLEDQEDGYLENVTRDVRPRLRRAR